MIVTDRALPYYRNDAYVTLTLVAGAFDPLHIGHLRYFQAAAALGFPLFCAVASDRAILAKGRPLLLPIFQRVSLIDALRIITYTYQQADDDTCLLLRTLQPRYYVKGDDWDGRLPSDQIETCREFGIEIRYVPTKVDSSSALLRSFVDAAKPVEKPCMT